MVDPSGWDEPLPENVVLALRAGSKIEAIRLLRQARAVDLKTAKDTIDRAVARNPDLQSTKLAPSSGAAALVILLAGLALLAGVIFYYLSRA